VEFFEFVKRWVVVSVIMFFSCLLSIYLTRKFTKYVTKLPILLYGLHPMSAHLILSEFYKQGKVTLLNIVAVIVCGNVILKIKEFLMYSIPIGLYVLKELWTYLLMVAVTYMIYLLLFAIFFMWKFGVGNIELTKREIEETFSIRKVIKLFLRVWAIYTIVYYLLTLLIISNYIKYIVNLLKVFPLNPYVSTLLTTYMFSPVATWQFIKYFWDSELLTITDVITVFVIGRYLHFILHVLRDGLPILTSLYGLKTGLKIISINISLLTTIYIFTYLTIVSVVNLFSSPFS